MRKTVIVLVCIGTFLAVGTVAAQDEANANGTDAGLALGEQISVLISAQEIGVRDTVEREAFEIEFKRRGAAAVEERAQTLEERLEMVRERKEGIREEYENGNISERRYKAKMAQLSLDSESVNRSADRVLERATGLERAGEQGVNVENIRRLKQNASNLTGPEVAEIARNIAGPPMGVGDRRGPPEGIVGGNATRGPPAKVNGSAPSEETDNRTDDDNRTRSQDERERREGSAGAQEERGGR